MEKNGGINQAAFKAAIFLCLLINMLTVGVVCYGWYNTAWESTLQRNINARLMKRIGFLEKLCSDQTRSPAGGGDRVKREVISSQKVDLQSLFRGAPGPLGPPGKDGRDGLPGRDGKDFASLNLLRDVIDESVKKEWTAISGSLPAYGGTFFTRWGRKSCPSTSTIVYRGQVTGPSWQSTGGGPNYQCLPEDPEYTVNGPKGYHSSLRAAHYRLPGKFDQRIPCTVCETKQRVSQLMIPAKIRCPSTEWTLEYRGYLASTAEYDSSTEVFMKTGYFKGSYICLDERAESLTSKPYPRAGPQIYHVNAACGSNMSGALDNCPPYRQNTALSCVVCSK